MPATLAQIADKPLAKSWGFLFNGTNIFVTIAMLKNPTPRQYTLEMVILEDLVPTDHLLRKIDQYIDFEFIRDAGDVAAIPREERTGSSGAHAALAGDE